MRAYSGTKIVKTKELTKFKKLFPFLTRMFYIFARRDAESAE